MDLPRQSLAAILVEQHKPLLIDTIELPQQLLAGQVLVKLKYSGICGSQLGEIDGVKGPDNYLPHLLGHEGCASVLATGPGVSHVKVHDTVVMHWRKGAGIDAQPANYIWKNNTLNAGQITTFNEYAVVSENRLTTIPNGLPPKLAPLLGCAVTTGFGVISNNAKLQIGESIAVYGAGGVGLNIIQAAALTSAYPIIAIDKYDNKLTLATTLGATHTINSTSQNVDQTIDSILGKNSLDVVVDNTGNPAVIEQCYQLSGAMGRVILVGVPAHDKNISLHSLALHFGRSITGSHGGESKPHEDIPRLLNLYNANRLDLSPLVTDYCSLEQINIAIDKMRKGEITGRCIIEFK